MDPTTFFCRHHVLQLFSKNIGAAHATKCCQNSWNRNFADFVDFKKKNRFGRSGLVSLQLLALYFALIWLATFKQQIVITLKSIYIYFKDFSDLFYIDIFSFSVINDKCLFTQWLMQSVCCTRRFDGLSNAIQQGASLSFL